MHIFGGGKNSLHEFPQTRPKKLCGKLFLETFYSLNTHYQPLRTLKTRRPFSWGHKSFFFLGEK